MRIFIPNSGKSTVIAVRCSIKDINFDPLFDYAEMIFQSDPTWKSNKLDSDKNFSLTAEEDNFKFIVFEKESENIFRLEIKHPFSILQALSIALSRF